MRSEFASGSIDRKMPMTENTICTIIKHKEPVMNRILFVLVALIMISPAVIADYEITWHTIDGGGGTSTGGPYELVGTIGQHDAGVVSGGDYVVSGGFWAGSFGCVVNITDLRILAEWWLESGAGLPADIDGNNTVDIADFAELAYWWHDMCPADWPVK